MSWVKTISRILLATLAILVIASLIAGRDHGGMKGLPVSLERVAFCIIAASVTAPGCAQAWRSFPAPFLAGIAGAIAAGEFASPYGGVLGLFAGVLIVAITPARCHRPHAEAEAKSADDRT
jgi:hypothetical protein